MKIINAGYEIVNKDNINGIELLKNIEKAGRTCYKSESNITEDSSKKFVSTIIKNGHESVLEHEKITVRIVCDRGVSHELVRHRLASFSQESQRFCNYSNDKFGSELTFIRPSFFENKKIMFDRWLIAMSESENKYFELLELGAKPQEARSVLPNSLKTEIVMTANLREWRHFFKLRADTPAHPSMREIAVPLLLDMQKLVPVVFDDVVNDLIGKGAI